LSMGLELENSFLMTLTVNITRNVVHMELYLLK